MANSNLSHLDDHEKNTNENSFSEIEIQAMVITKFSFLMLIKFTYEDRIHLLLDMPGLDEASCEIELIPEE